MKRLMTLLAVAMIPAGFSGCASCCPSLALCPCCPCNWFNRAPACPPAPAPICPPATTYAAPVAATACPPAYPPVASQMMPQYFTPAAAAPMAATAPAACNPCQAPAMAQPPMYYPQAQPAYYAEPSCGYGAMMEPGCGGPSMGVVGYGPIFDCGPCDCCEAGGGFTAPDAATFPPAPTPTPGE